MEKIVAKKPAKRKTTRSGSEVLGVTKDGVKILKPKNKPTSFTVEQAREMVAYALRKSA